MKLLTKMINTDEERSLKQNTRRSLDHFHSMITSISKEEKEKENNKKSSPIKQHTIRPSLKSLAHDKHLSSERRKVEKIDETKKEVPRSRKEYLIRHHLERTTGATDGALLPSPTREKLEPAGVLHYQIQNKMWQLHLLLDQ
ncbi:Protein of unknown function [Gryllus bimaculatus]|nr:Protein of unknown function [Gryllus bimaculatus]